jgi:TetR/AcrR family transcriptional regulator, copper-responsive repressor
MGINPPSLYASFGDKRALFQEAVQRYRSRYAAFIPSALAEAPTARDALEQVLWQAAVEYTDPSHPPGCLVASAGTNCGPDSADVRESLRAGRHATQQAIKDRIEDDVRAGRLPDGTDPAALAAFYAAVLQGMSTQARDGGSTADLRHIADAAMRCWPV